MHYVSQSEWMKAARNFVEHAERSKLITSESSSAAKLVLFRSLFKGRSDVYAHGYRRKDGGIGYVPACANEWKRGLCPKSNQPRFRCADCRKRDFLPLTDKALIGHFRGEDAAFKDVIGLYVLDESCRTSVLVVDFDKEGWQEAIRTFREVASELGIMVAVERSRSGNGAHGWIFFDEPIAAKVARELGSTIITKAMARCDALSFASYDRMFPAQDTIPEGSFGNLIALPFQGRAQREGNSVFIDDEFKAIPDQWLFLSEVKKIPAARASAIAEEYQGLSLGLLGDVMGERQKSGSRPWATSRRIPFDASDFPDILSIVRGNMLYIAQEGLSPAGRDCLVRLAAFGNPEFYRAQAMHQPVFGKPRIVCLAEEREGWIALPRGTEDRLLRALKEAGITFDCRDERYAGGSIDVGFCGVLRPEQQEAVDRLLAFEDGILSAPTGFGKTVIGAYLIAALKMPTLVIVPKTALLVQWRERLEAFLDIREELAPVFTKAGRKSKKKRSLVGQIGGGKNRPSGVIDIATFQSLVEKSMDEDMPFAKEVVRDYGLVIVDECHHGAAPQLELILKAITARNVYGLSATPKRADGMEGAIYLLCGPIRHKVDPKEHARQQNYDCVLRPRFTGIRLPRVERGASYNQVLDGLCSHDARNRVIAEDVTRSVAVGKTPLVISKRKDHARLLSEMISALGCDARLLVGEGTPKQKQEALERVKQEGTVKGRVLVATESYLGEGFDMSELDALFLATPISWDGNLVQQSGRLHREHEGKREVWVYDYIDASVPMLERMYKKRLKAYAALGYKVHMADEDGDSKAGMFAEGSSCLSLLRTDIENAVHSVSIFAPYVSSGMIRQLISSLRDAVLRGLSVHCTVGRFYQGSKDGGVGSEADSCELARRLLESTGCLVEEDPDAPSCLAVIDREVVWFGTLPLLAFPKKEDCSLRFKSAEVAHEILEEINTEKRSQIAGSQ